MKKSNAKILESFLAEHTFSLAFNTRDSYRISINEFFLWCSKEINKVVEDDIRDWLKSLNTRGFSPATLNARLSGLKCFFNYCIEENYLVYNPTIGIKAIKPNPGIPVTFDTQTLFFIKEASKGNLRDRAMIELFLCSGIRVSELIGIKKNEVDWTRGVILIHGKGEQERYAMATIECLERLKRYLNSRIDNSDSLFIGKSGKALTRQGVWKIVKKYVNIAGFKSKGSPHVFRHTCATILKEKGANDFFIARILGQSNPNNVKIYTKLDDRRRKEHYDKYC